MTDMSSLSRYVTFLFNFSWHNSEKLGNYHLSHLQDSSSRESYFLIYLTPFKFCLPILLFSILFPIVFNSISYCFQFYFLLFSILFPNVFNSISYCFQIYFLIFSILFPIVFNSNSYCFQFYFLFFSIMFYCFQLCSIVFNYVLLFSKGAKGRKLNGGKIDGSRI